MAAKTDWSAMDDGSNHHHHLNSNYLPTNLLS